MKTRFQVRGSNTIPKNAPNLLSDLDSHLPFICLQPPSAEKVSCSQWPLPGNRAGVTLLRRGRFLSELVFFATSGYVLELEGSSPHPSVFHLPSMEKHGDINDAEEEQS